MAQTFEDGVPMPQRLWAVAAISTGIVMATLDSAVANVALPSIARDLGSSASATVWVVNAYQLTVAVSLLSLSTLAQIWGFRRTFWGGLLVFTVASVACGLSVSLPMLVAARIVQGAGAAGMLAIYPALLAYIYPRASLGRGVGISATIVALAGALGPSVSAAVLSVASWGWLFLINLPIGAVGLAIGARSLPRIEPVRRPFDAVAGAVSALAIGLLVIGIDWLGRAGGRTGALAEIALALVTGAWLLRREGRRTLPLVPVDLLRIPMFSLSVGTAMCSYAAQALCLISLPFLLQDRLGLTAVASGLVMTAIPLAVAIVAPVMGGFADRYPAGFLCGIGLLIMGSGLLALVLLPANPGTDAIVWREMLVGFGFGMYQTPNNRAVLSTGPRSRSGSAGGMLSTARLLGLSIGASLVAVFFEVSAAGGTRYALTAASVIAFCGALVSVSRMASEAPRQA